MEASGTIDLVKAGNMHVVQQLGAFDKVLFIKLVNAGQYYPKLHAQDLNGVPCWGIYRGDGELVGGVMVIIQGLHSYLDYLYIAPQWRNMGYGVRLLNSVRGELFEQGVRYVYASISGLNEVSGKLALQHRGKIGFPYLHVRVDLEEEDGEFNHDHGANVEHSGSQPAGDSGS